MLRFPEISINREPLPLLGLRDKGRKQCYWIPVRRVTRKELYSWTCTATAKDRALKQEESKNKYSDIVLIPPVISLS